MIPAKTNWTDDIKGWTNVKEYSELKDMQKSVHKLRKDDDNIQTCIKIHDIEADWRSSKGNE